MLERGRPELQWRTILAGVAGNVMEWYDFSVYGYFAAVPGRVSFVHKKGAGIRDRAKVAVLATFVALASRTW